jgi:hypothetical protein
VKKILLIGLGIGMLNLAKANTFTISDPIVVISSISGIGAMNGNNAYEWGIPISLLSGQTINSATLAFNGIVLTAGGTGGNNIKASLLNLNNTGTITWTDNDAPSDYFNSTKFKGSSSTSGDYKNTFGSKPTSGYYTSLGTSQTFSLNSVAADWSVTFSAAQLNILNADVLDGKFDIGIDPDCHFNVGSIKFTYTISTPLPPSVPDTAAAAGLLGMSFLGLLAFRRKLAFK